MLNFTELIQTFKSLIETRIELVKSDIQDQLVGILSPADFTDIDRVNLIGGRFISFLISCFLH